MLAAGWPKLDTLAAKTAPAIAPGPIRSKSRDYLIHLVDGSPPLRQAQAEAVEQHLLGLVRRGHAAHAERLLLPVGRVPLLLSSGPPSTGGAEPGRDTPAGRRGPGDKAGASSYADRGDKAGALSYAGKTGESPAATGASSVPPGRPRRRRLSYGHLRGRPRAGIHDNNVSVGIVRPEPRPIPPGKCPNSAFAGRR